MVKSVHPEAGLVNGLRGVIIFIRCAVVLFGTRAVIIYLKCSGGLPVVLFSSGIEQLIQRETFTLTMGGQVVAKRYQVQ